MCKSAEEKTCILRDESVPGRGGGRVREAGVFAPIDSDAFASESCVWAMPLLQQTGKRISESIKVADSIILTMNGHGDINRLPLA
jgi:hypothetical protein